MAKEIVGLGSCMALSTASVPRDRTADIAEEIMKDLCNEISAEGVNS